MKKTFINWSSGKDAALAFYRLSKNKDYEVSHLLTSINEHYSRVTMHGLRIELLEAQISALNLPYTLVKLPKTPSNEVYENLMRQHVTVLKEKGYDYSVFGDIFLEDLKAYREKQLQKIDIKPVFPLWKESTTDLAHEFLEYGFKAIVICIDGTKLDKSFVGREFDKSFLDDLPKNVDPCGENGEFHTFCYEGPIFSEPISFKKGKIEARVYKNNEKNQVFYFQDIVLN